MNQAGTMSVKPLLECNILRTRQEQINLSLKTSPVPLEYHLTRHVGI